MQNFLIILFWLGIALVVYTYVGYGVVIGVLVKLKNALKPEAPLPPLTDFPTVAFVIAAYNEEDYIRDKVANSLKLDYPADKLDIIFVTDGSSDQTPHILREYEAQGIRVLHEDARRGKIHAMHRAMGFVEADIAIFSDANTDLNPEALQEIVKHYQNPKVGAVAGEKRIKVLEKDAANGAGEGIYWKYESWLKKMDSAFYSVVGAAGELFSVRTKLYEQVPANALLDDFMLSMRIAQKGYRVKYEPQAQAWETPSSSVKEEFKRKIRICAGGIQSILWLLPLLNIFKYGWLSFQYVSHRVLRWTLTPLSLLAVFTLNVWLALFQLPFYQVMLGLQVLFYLTALLGWWLQTKKIKLKALFVPYYFVVMNLSVFLGFFRFIKGQQSVAWEKAARRKE
ncbi:glycosyltransferase family 2 protein [Microscilla marina]|uniref:Two-component system sensor histidine kinase/response regulator, hybrid n=1 Tax=Microscilla marina ATCC 23134 TaxID=313606 RepID=A1ZS81_MICM2|nr:glycosyltransferase family 2 protein [Microscilla marina]EAY26804.1 two-component system sensor histidine kinase/response regulator, hybrid [Microscilla marina ATCC 23134]